MCTYRIDFFASHKRKEQALSPSENYTSDTKSIIHSASATPTTTTTATATAAAVFYSDASESGKLSDSTLLVKSYLKPP